MFNVVRRIPPSAEIARGGTITSTVNVASSMEKVQFRWCVCLDNEITAVRSPPLVTEKGSIIPWSMVLSYSKCKLESLAISSSNCVRRDVCLMIEVINSKGDSLAKYAREKATLCFKLDDIKDIASSKIVDLFSTAPPKITIVGCISELKYPTPIKLRANDLLLHMFKSQYFHDVVIKTIGEDFTCHKAVLAAASPVFHTMFETKMNERKDSAVDLTSVFEKEAVRDLLSYIYCNKTPNIKNTCAQLLVSADLYQLRLLKRICEEQLISQISIINVVDYLLLSERYNAPLLKYKVIKFIAANNEVVNTDKWEAVPADMAKQLLKSFATAFCTFLYAKAKV